MSSNGQSKSGLIVPPPLPDANEKMCHRIFVPVPLAMEGVNPISGQKGLQVNGQIINFKCMKERCSLWDEKKSQCLDRTQAEHLETLAEYAYAMRNDMHIQNAGV